MRKTIIILIIPLLFFACKTQQASLKTSEIFNILNKITYQNTEITNKNIGYKTITHFLNENEIQKLETWKSPDPILKNFNTTDCIGCNNNLKNFIPLYKVEKGNLIHFGLKKSMGIENLVFNKNGSFITHFFSYQGYSQAQIKKHLKQRGNRGYVIEGIYPTKITTNEIYLKHLEYSNQKDNGEWFNTTFPMELDYYINLKEKEPVLQFKFKSGFFSYQKNDKSGNLRIIHFFEPEFITNTIKTYGYYGEATFFLISLEEEKNLVIDIESNIDGKEFEFSIFKNNTFYTIDEFINKKSNLYSTYNKTLEKGTYLIRVINGKSTYWNEALFELKLRKETP